MIVALALFSGGFWLADRSLETRPVAGGEKLLASYDTLPGSLRGSVIAAVVSSWARTEPQQATEWALAHINAEDAMSPANTPARRSFLRGINNKPDNALEWWRELPSSALRDALGANASNYLNESAGRHLAQFQARRDPATAGGWLAKIPAGVASEAVAREAVNAW